MNDLGVFGLHLKWSVLRFAAPVLAVLAAAIAVASAPDRVITSPEISAVLLRTQAILAPVLAAVAAWDGLRERRGGGGFLLDNAPRPGGQAALIQAAAGVVWTALVWALPLLCLIGYAWLLGSLTDPPQLLNLAIIAVLVAWLTVLGYLLGFLIRHWLAVLAAALIPAALYGVAVFPALGDLLTAINPFVDRSGYEFYTPEPAYLAGVLLCLTGAAAITLGLFMLLSRPVRWTAALAGVTGLALVLGGGGIVAAHDGRWATAVDVTDRLVPLSSRSLTLSVLPPWVTLKDDLLDRWSQVQAIFADTPLAFSELAQDTDSHPENETGFTHLYLTSRGDVVGESIAASLIDVIAPECGAQEGWIWTFLIQNRIAGPRAYPGTSWSDEHAAALESLQSLSTDDLAEWMAEHHDGFVTCTLSADDLPLP